MWASKYGHHEVVRTLLECGADVNDKTNVRNQLMIIIITILFTILMMMLMMMMIEDRCIYVNNR